MTTPLSQGEAEAKFMRPRSLYIEATGVKDDGTEVVYRMRMEAAHPSLSEMTLDMESLTVDGPWNGLYATHERTGEHNVEVTFTRCRVVEVTDRDADPIKRMLALHALNGDGYCQECTGWDRDYGWEGEKGPCETVRILTGSG